MPSGAITEAAGNVYRFFGLNYNKALYKGVRSSYNRQTDLVTIEKEQNNNEVSLSLSQAFC